MTTDVGRFDLWRLDQGHAYDEFVRHLQEEERRLESGEPPLGHPDFATLAGSARAEPGGRGTLSNEAAAGEYALACIWFDLNSGPVAYSPIGPFALG
jgi:hypothetical protein